MFWGTWLLGVLCAAGALLAAISVVSPLVRLRRVRARVDAFAHSRFMTSLFGFQAQSRRFQRQAQRMKDLPQQAAAAAQQVPRAFGELRIEEPRAAIRAAAHELRELLHDLR